MTELSQETLNKIMTPTTALEATVLLQFNVYKDDPEATISDLGVSWTDAKELAKNAKLPINVTKGVLGSLVKKGLVHQGDDDGAMDMSGRRILGSVCLTEDGVLTRHAIPADFDPVIWDAAKAATDALNADLVKAAAEEAVAIDMGTPFPGIICSTLRAHAFPWEGSRKEFIDAVALCGFNRNTAATQWQKARGK